MGERKETKEKKRKETQIPFHPKMKRWIEAKGKSKDQEERRKEKRNKRRNEKRNKRRNERGNKK